MFKMSHLSQILLFLYAFCFSAAVTFGLPNQTASVLNLNDFVPSLLIDIASLLMEESTLGEEYVINNKRFPSNFMFGVSTAAYQIEGAWNEDGKSPSIWDNITHSRPDYILNRDNGDIACDSYHKFEEDVRILKELGVAHYRSSLAWTRILPEGLATKVNVAGIEYYKKLIKSLRANNIEPVVTLYHWDLPQVLQDKGGFVNESIIQWFSDYARICFENFGEEIKYWITFNEPKQICMAGYGNGDKAPAIKADGILDYVCVHNLLKAHAATWHIYDDEFRSKQGGKVSVSFDTSWYEPASKKSEDLEAAETALQFEFGWFAHPVFIGDYPEIMKTRIANRSKAEGFKKSRLPEFTEEEISYIKGTHDFIGINTYTSAMVKAIPEPDIIAGKPSHYSDMGVATYFLDSWKKSSLDWLRVVPFGIRKLVTYIKNTLNDPEIFITENGVSDLGTPEDDDRIYYIQNYVSNLRDAMEKDDVKVIGYTVWSVMDNFEWNVGYKHKFGLYQVNFESSNRTRTPKKSASFYRHLCQTHCLVEKCID